MKLIGAAVEYFERVVRLIHQGLMMTMNSVKSSPDDWRHSLNLVESNLILTKICLSYLLFHELNRPIAAEDTRLEMALLHDFLDYAASHWVTHSRQAGIEDDSSMLQLILDVCDTKSNRFRRWTQFAMPFFPLTARSSHIFTDLVIATYFELGIVVKLRLSKSLLRLKLKIFLVGQRFQWPHLKGILGFSSCCLSELTLKSIFKIMEVDQRLWRMKAREILAVLIFIVPLVI